MSLRKEEFYFTSIGEPSWSWSYGSWIYNYLCVVLITTNM